MRCEIEPGEHELDFDLNASSVPEQPCITIARAVLESQLTYLRFFKLACLDIDAAVNRLSEIPSMMRGAYREEKVSNRTGDISG